MFNILVNNTISLTHSNIGIVPGQELPEAIGQNGYISLLQQKGQKAPAF